MSGYDTALTVFSPNGHLFQVEYAMEAVKQGLCSVGVRCKDAVILGVEKKTSSKLQGTRTQKKILQIDDNVCLSFSGLNADARILTNIARDHCQSYRLNYDDNPPIDNIAKYVSSVQQKYTQKGGVRPFGISTLLAGFDSNNQPRLYQTDPSGACTEWKAAVLGKNSKTVSEYLEKNFAENLSVEQGLKIACQALMDVVESGKNNVGLMVVKRDGPVFLDESQMNQLVNSISEEAK